MGTDPDALRESVDLRQRIASMQSHVWDHVTSGRGSLKNVVVHHALFRARLFGIMQFSLFALGAAVFCTLMAQANKWGSSIIVI